MHKWPLLSVALLASACASPLGQTGYSRPATQTFEL